MQAEIDPISLILHRQFTSAMLMLRETLHNTPQTLWEKQMWVVVGENPVFSQPWYIFYHTLFFADLYLQTTDEGYAPPAPFNLDELDPAGIPPGKVFNKTDLEVFITYILAKSDAIFPKMTNEKALRVAEFSWGFKLPYFELVIDNIRHIQEHSAQCSMFIGQYASHKQKWISGA